MFIFTVQISVLTTSLASGIIISTAQSGSMVLKAGAAIAAFLPSSVAIIFFWTQLGLFTDRIGAWIRDRFGRSRSTRRSPARDGGSPVFGHTTAAMPSASYTETTMYSPASHVMRMPTDPEVGLVAPLVK